MVGIGYTYKSCAGQVVLQSSAIVEVWWNGKVRKVWLQRLYDQQGPDFTLNPEAFVVGVDGVGIFELLNGEHGWGERLDQEWLEAITAVAQGALEVAENAPQFRKRVIPALEMIKQILLD